MNSDITIPNLVEYNLLLLDEDDPSQSDRKYMPLAKGEDDVHLPNTAIHTIMNIDSSDQLIWADVSLQGDIIAWGFNTGIVKVYMYK